MEIEQEIGTGNGELMTATIGKIEPADVLEADIEELKAGMDRALERRQELHDQAEGIITETEEIDTALRDARVKVDRLRGALELAREAAELTPNLPAELKPAGGFEAPPTEEPSASTPSSNGNGPDEEADPDAAPPVGGPVDEDLAKAAEPDHDDPAGDTAEAGGGQESGAGAAPPPSGEEPAGDAKAKVLDVVRRAGEPVANSEVAQVTDFAPEKVRRLVKELAGEGKVRISGKARWTRYEIAESKTPATPPARRKARPSSEDKKGPKTSAKQEPTAAGRVLNALQLGSQDIASLSISVGIAIPQLRGVLGELIRDGDVRLHRGNPPEYSLAP